MISFLIECMQQVQVCKLFSTIFEVVSDLVLGNILGLDFYIISSDSLLCFINLSVLAYIDDFEFLADVQVHTIEEIQSEEEKVYK